MFHLYKKTENNVSWNIYITLTQVSSALWLPFLELTIRSGVWAIIFTIIVTITAVRHSAKGCSPCSGRWWPSPTIPYNCFPQGASRPFFSLDRRTYVNHNIRSIDFPYAFAFGKILDCIKKHICGKGIIYLKRGINTQEKASNIFLKLLLLPTADLKLIYSLRPAVVVPSV